MRFPPPIRPERPTRGTSPFQPASLIARGILLLMSLTPSLLFDWARFDDSARAQDHRVPNRPYDDWRAEGSKGAVAAGGRAAVAAGMTQLRQGGNAADAAAATLVALAVTDSRDYCFGGEIPILIKRADSHQVEVIAGQGVAPRLAVPEAFTSRGFKAIPESGLRSAAVPGAPDAIVTLLARHGRRTFAQIIEPTLAILDQHHAPWHADFAATLRTMAQAETDALASGADRVAALKAVSDHFYRGPIAQRIGQWCEANDGLLRAEDFAAHTTPIESTVTLTYHGHVIHKCGVWTQGPALIQTLRLFDDGTDPKARGPKSAEETHRLVESLKLAFADRDAFYADPLVETVPLDRLLDPEYARIRRALIEPTASLVQRPGNPFADNLANRALLSSDQAAARLRFADETKPRDTTTCVTADAEGNMVAATPSGWKGVVAGDTGVWLGTRLQSLNLFDGHPNQLAPGKRPRITLTPTLVLDTEGQPVTAISVAGGDGQDQMILQLLIDTLVHGLEPAQAVVAPRWLSDHHVGSFCQTPPQLGQLRMTPDWPEATRAALEARGHKIVVAPPPLSLAPVMLTRDPQTGLLCAAGDPRASRHAAAG